MKKKTILLNSVGLSGFIYVEKVRFFLSVAPQPMQITFFRVHDDHVMCVDIDTHILVQHSPANRKTSLKVTQMAYQHATSRRKLPKQSILDDESS